MNKIKIYPMEFFPIYNPMEFRFNDPNCFTDEVFVFVTDQAIPNIKPHYYISNYSRFYSMASNRLMMPTMMKSTRRTGGYYCNSVQTYNGPQTVLNHRVSMMCWKYEPGCESLEVDHIDGCKTNEFIGNLEWVTGAENTRRASKNNLLLTGEDASWTKTSDDQVHMICQLYVQGLGPLEIGRSVGVSPEVVYRIVHGQSRTNISSQYDIGIRYRGIIPENIMDKVCSIYENFNGYKYNDIKKYLIDNIFGTKYNIHIDRILRCLYKRDPYCYPNIWSKYNYEPL